MVTQHSPYALVIGIDGVRPDALRKAKTPHLDQLTAEGLSSFSASTQLEAPTKSGPGWASVLTGVDANKHGVVANEGYEGRNPAFPTFVARAQSEAAVRSAVGASWIHVHSLIEDDATNIEWWAPDDPLSDWLAERIVTGPEELFFVHFDDVDHAGHASGFSPENAAYLAEVEDVDRQIGKLLRAIDERSNRRDERWLIAVTTDHGGEGTDHGALDAANRTIFVILSGDGISPGELGAASHLDVAPTVLDHLGAEPKADWGLDGRSLLP